MGDGRTGAAQPRFLYRDTSNHPRERPRRAGEVEPADRARPEPGAARRLRHSRLRRIRGRGPAAPLGARRSRAAARGVRRPSPPATSRSPAARRRRRTHHPAGGRPPGSPTSRSPDAAATNSCTCRSRNRERRAGRDGDEKRMNACVDPQPAAAAEQPARCTLVHPTMPMVGSRCRGRCAPDRGAEKCRVQDAAVGLAVHKLRPGYRTPTHQEVHVAFAPATRGDAARI